MLRKIKKDLEFSPPSPIKRSPAPPLPVSPFPSSFWWGLGLSFALSVIYAPTQVNAASSVILKYGFLQESISVPELSTFAETGEMSSSLRAYLALANQNPEVVRKVFTDKISVNPILLSQILNSPLGEMLLDGVSQYIKTPSGRSSRESLRGALLTSALDDSNIRLIEVLENYPTSELHVEGDRLAEVYRRLQEVIEQIPLI
jgi:hypothetical protein